MFISKKRFQEELLKEREQAFNEAMKRQDEENRLRYLHERIDRLEKRVYKLEDAGKPEFKELNTCVETKGCY